MKQMKQMKQMIKFSMLIGLFCIFSGGFAFADQAGEDLVAAARAEDETALRNALRYGANVNYLSNERTALMEACFKGWLNGVKILLEEGKANPSSKNAYYQTALMFAAQRNNDVAIARLLVERGANINDRDNQSNTVLMYAAENQNDVMIDFFLRAGANIGATNIKNEDALMIAVKNKNRFAVVKLLERAGINWSQTDIDGNTAFILACENGSTDILRIFVEKGFDVNARPVGGAALPPLLWLIRFKKSMTIIQLLLENTEAIHSRDSSGRDAFWYARNYDNGNARLMQLLNANNR